MYVRRRGALVPTEVKALYGQHVSMKTTPNKYTREGVFSSLFFLDPTLMAATYGGGLFATLNPPIAVAEEDDWCASARYLLFRSFYEKPVGAMLMVVKKLWDVASQTISRFAWCTIPCHVDLAGYSNPAWGSPP